METINAYPTLEVERYNLTRADLCTKGLNLYIIVERDHNYYDDSDTNFLYFDADDNRLKTGQWTTRGYCGDFYYDYPRITEADNSIKEKALVAMRDYAKSASTPSSLTTMWWSSEFHVMYREAANIKEKAYWLNYTTTRAITVLRKAFLYGPARRWNLSTLVS